ncbi:hypothetical protein RhiTH_006181 [Rhizoctonia solani]
MIASLIELKTHGLSLFDALIVTMLTTIMTAFVTANIAYSRTLGLSINISSFLFTTFWVYWGLQVWNDPKTFGIPEGEENCNASIDTVFVVFGQNVSVTNSGLRGFAMFIFAIGSISALAALWQCIKWTFLYAIGGAEKAKRAAAEEYVRKLRGQRSAYYALKTDGTRSDRSGTSVQHMSFFGGAAGMIYMIITTEQIVRRNQDVSTQVNDWSYSQTLAMIMLGQQLMDCCTYIRQEVEYKKKERARANGDV